MNEEMDLNTKLDALMQAINDIVAKVDEISTRQDELDSVLYDGLIGPANEQLAQNEYDNALSDFRAKYAEKLGPLEEVSKAVEGDDFDIYKAAFDGYNEGGYDFSPDEYIEKVTESLTEQVNHIKEVVAQAEGVAPEDVHVEVEGTNENGEPKVEVEVESEEDHKEEEATVAEEGETKEEVDEKAEAEVDHTDEEKPETEAEPEPEVAPEDEVDELKQFEESLKKEAEKDKDVSWIRG